MKKTRKTHSLILIPAAALMLAACQKIEMVGTPSQPSGSGTPIRFGLGFEPDVVKSAPAAAAPVSSGSFVLRSTDGSSDSLCMQSIETGRSLLSKGSPVGQDNFYTDFYVFSRTTDDVLFMEAKATATDLVGSNGLKVWETQPTYYWPGSDYKLNFFAGAPAEVFQNGKEGSISYTVPADVTAQKDLMAATKLGIAGNNNSTVDLEFKHICTAVSFAFGTEMQPGTIKSIALKGVYGSGSYSFDLTNGGGSWTTSGNPTDFTQTLDKATTGSESEGTAITEAAATFMMIPQPLPDGATVEVVFNSTISGEKTLSASIARTTWSPDRSITYKLSISPDYTLEFTSVPDTQDAHYEIATFEVNAADLPATTQWTIKAEASDRAAVTVQLESEVNSFVKEGFWTDRKIENGADTGSARGSESISCTGSGTQTVYLFLPENAGTEDRKITLSIYLNDDTANAVSQEIIQKAPAWASACGWEQIDDHDTGAYGMNWDRKVGYIFPYNLHINGWWGVKYTESEARALMNAIINQYNAGSYASLQQYTVERWLNLTRIYILIDYSLIGGDGKAESPADGSSNTKDLYDISGTAVTGEFEEALKNTYKTESGATHQQMFREPNDTEKNSYGVPWEEGTNAPQSGILSYALKKNRYNLVKTTSNGNTTEAPSLSEDGIVWYIPAFEQFNNLPQTVEDKIDPASYWSSTIATGGQAYLGNSTTADRSTNYGIRVVRKQ